MKALLVIAVAGGLASPAVAQNTVAVGGYVNSNGEYVAPHYRTAPDSTRTNNWSVRPNVNPYTGKVGTQSPYKPYEYKPYTYKPYRPK